MVVFIKKGVFECVVDWSVFSKVNVCECLLKFELEV